MKKFLIIFLVTSVFVACSGYGTKLEYNGTDVYYTDKVDKKDAEKLGDYLVKSEFADGNVKSVQITKNDDSKHFIFRMVATKEASESKKYETIFKLYAQQLSDSVFNKQPVDFDVCDNTFTTLKTITFETAPTK